MITWCIILNVSTFYWPFNVKKSYNFHSVIQFNLAYNQSVLAEGKTDIILKQCSKVIDDTVLHYPFEKDMFDQYPVLVVCPHCDIEVNYQSE